MKIRHAERRDFAQIKKIVALYPEKLMQSPLPKIRDFFVAEENGEIVGCSALEVYSKRLAEIRSLVVDPRFQKRGIGALLVKECLKRAKKARVYEVLSITGAAGLFGKLGFKTFNQEKLAMLRVVRQ